eukprot:TRINITY_DN13094_c0_g1_i1.p2 TRINITY_DN13094_c0_g1~~TRINITY_DN13094_c0_g1_i1.p2  ORF type:complete len:100 (-),score=7.11 TRINITY_DN13094_c0_g1_i1:3-302(-)
MHNTFHFIALLEFAMLYAVMFSLPFISSTFYHPHILIISKSAVPYMRFTTSASVCYCTLAHLRIGNAPIHQYIRFIPFAPYTLIDLWRFFFSCASGIMD